MNVFFCNLLSANSPIVTNEVPQAIRQAAPKKIHNGMFWSKNFFPTNTPLNISHYNNYKFNIYYNLIAILIYQLLLMCLQIDL